MAKKIKTLLSLTIVIVLALSFTVGFASEEAEAAYGEKAYAHVQYLSQEIGLRAAGSQQEKDAADYIKSQYESFGYTVETQPFTFEGEDGELESQNLIIPHPANSEDKEYTVYVGAHYDSTGDDSQGAHDNASGTGVVLEAAERVVDFEPHYNLVFLAFGAEELGLIGSDYFVANMTGDEIGDTAAMINLDSLIGGDYLYIHGTEGAGGWVRDQILESAQKLDLNIRVQPGLNPDYPEGVGYPASDHVPFEMVDIPYANYESTNWEEDQLDEEMTGYVETVEQGVIWHTERDRLEFLEEAFPGRVEERLKDSAQSLTDIIEQLVIE